MMRILIAFVLVGLLGACETFTEADCAGAQWFEIGVAAGDGPSADEDSALARYRRICGAAGVDAPLFRLGYRSGNERFCRPGAAYAAVALGRREEGAFLACDGRAPTAAAFAARLRGEVRAVRDARRANICQSATTCPAAITCSQTCARDAYDFRLDVDCASICWPAAYDPGATYLD